MSDLPPARDGLQKHGIRFVTNRDEWTDTCRKCGGKNLHVKLDRNRTVGRWHCDDCEWNGCEPPDAAKVDGGGSVEIGPSAAAFASPEEQRAFEETRREFEDDLERGQDEGERRKTEAELEDESEGEKLEGEAPPPPPPPPEEPPPSPRDEGEGEGEGEPEIEPKPEPPRPTIEDTTALRRALVAAGYVPLPLYGKTPPVYGKNNPRKGFGDWQNLTVLTDEMIAMWARTWPDAINTGVLTRSMPTLDLDILNEDAARACEDLVREHYEFAGIVLTRIGKPPKRAIPFRTDEAFEKITANLIASNRGEGQKIEFLADGQQVVVAGIHPDTKKLYRWHGGEPGAIKREELPYIREAEAQALVDDLVELLVRDFGYTRAAGRPGKGKGEGCDRGGDRGGDADWAYLFDNIRAGRELHDSLRDLAAKMIRAGTNAGAVVNQLRALMEGSSAPHDERWRERYDDIPRCVRGAEICRIPRARLDDPQPDPYADRFKEESGAPKDAKSGGSQQRKQRDLEKHVRRARQRRALPEITTADGILLEVIEAAEAAILAAPEQHLFQRGGMLVRLKRITQKTLDLKPITAKTSGRRGITRDAGSLIIAEATPECVRLEMMRTARYQKWNADAGEWVPTDPLIKYARAIAARDEFSFKTLLATIETPTLRPDGSILQTPGYDEATGLYFDSAQSFPAINSNPSKDDAAAALCKIGEVLKDFPFISGAARAVANAAILTPLVRRILPSAPMFLFDAPVAGSGKSLLASVVARIATGREPATQPFTGEPEEDRKRIVATLIAADPVVSFDNILLPLQDATLCKALSQPVMDDRLLSTMMMLRLPTCTTWLGTGVNLTVVGRELIRRTLRCRIDPKMEHPEERKFDYVLLDDVMEQRVKLVVAGLTIIRAYIVAGCPEQKIEPYGGFEGWSTLVRAPLVWLGCDDPCAVREQAEAADPDKEKLANLLDALAGYNTDFTTAEVVAKAHKDARDAAAYGGDVPLLYHALAALCYKGNINTTAVGKAFAKHVDRIVDRRKLKRTGMHNGWQYGRLRLFRVVK